jgi:hypothetical protein
MISYGYGKVMRSWRDHLCWGWEMIIRIGMIKEVCFRKRMGKNRRSILCDIFVGAYLWILYMYYCYSLREGGEVGKLFIDTFANGRYYYEIGVCRYQLVLTVREMLVIKNNIINNLQLN